MLKSLLSVSTLTQKRKKNEFYQGELTIIFLVIFEDIASEKLEKSANFFSTFKADFDACHL